MIGHTRKDTEVLQNNLLLCESLYYNSGLLLFPDSSKKSGSKTLSTLIHWLHLYVFWEVVFYHYTLKDHLQSTSPLYFLIFLLILSVTSFYQTIFVT